MSQLQEVLKMDALYFVLLLAVLSTSYDFVCGDSFYEQLDEMNIDKEMFQFRDLFTLTSTNFSRGVLDSPDPWVVVLHRGSVSMEWKKAAVRSRGVVWFGMVNLDSEKHLIREMNIKNPEGITTESDIARVYPFGRRSKKMKKHRDVYKASTALAQAVLSLPMDAIITIEDGDDLNKLVMDCLLTSPTRFPAIFIYDNQVAFPPEFISISIHLKRYFNFGRLDTELSHELLSLGVKQDDINVPTLIVVTTKIGDGGRLIHRGVRCKYEKPSENTADTGKKYEVPSYTKILECLYKINSRYREDLPGNNMSTDEEVMTMEDVLEQEVRRFKINASDKPQIVASVGRRSDVNVEVVDSDTVSYSKTEL